MDNSAMSKQATSYDSSATKGLMCFSKQDFTEEELKHADLNSRLV